MDRWFLCLFRSGAFKAMVRVLTVLDRAGAGCDPLPTTAVVDAQAARLSTIPELNGIGVAIAK